jgi:hypothetical protein
MRYWRPAFFTVSIQTTNDLKQLEFMNVSLRKSHETSETNSRSASAWARFK